MKQLSRAPAFVTVSLSGLTFSAIGRFDPAIAVSLHSSCICDARAFLDGSFDLFHALTRRSRRF